MLAASSSHTLLLLNVHGSVYFFQALFNPGKQKRLFSICRSERWKKWNLRVLLHLSFIVTTSKALSRAGWQFTVLGCGSEGCACVHIRGGSEV